MNNNTNVFLKLLLLFSVCSVPPKTSSSVSIYLSDSSLYSFVHPLLAEFGAQQKPNGKPLKEYTERTKEGWSDKLI